MNMINGIESAKGYFFKGNFYTDLIISAEEVNNHLVEADETIVIVAKSYVKNNKMKKIPKDFSIITDFGSMSFQDVKNVISMRGIGFPISTYNNYGNLIVIDNRRETVLRHLINI